MEQVPENPSIPCNDPGNEKRPAQFASLLDCPPCQAQAQQKQRLAELDRHEHALTIALDQHRDTPLGLGNLVA
jgi:hypothetical protein